MQSPAIHFYPRVLEEVDNRFVEPYYGFKDHIMDETNAKA
jgi:hypothetical protein